MKPIPGKYERDGEVFHYEIHCTSTQWSARVTDSNQQLVGTPRVALSGMLLSEAAQSDLAKSWIELSIRDRAGVD